MAKEENQGHGPARRDVLKGAAAVAVASVFPGVVHAQEPKRGGVLRLGTHSGQQTDTLDPGTWPGSFTQVAFSGSLYNTLTEILADGTVAPDLAEFERSPDAKTWKFKLRNGITFHDGKSLVAKDVVESFRYHMGPNSKSSARNLLNDIADIKEDGSSVVFELKNGSADFPYLVADYHLVIMQAKPEGGIDWQKGIGTGAFSLEKFDPGVSVTMKRNNNYHKNNKPYFDRFEMSVLADANARVNALLTGQVDYIANVPSQRAALITRNPAFAVMSTPSLSHQTFDMDMSKPPFNDPNVRLALKYALDRDDVVRKIFLGDATNSGSDNPVAKPMTFYSEVKTPHSYNIEKAKEHLAKSGHKSLEVDLSVARATFPGAVDAAILFKESAAKAGIKINVIHEPDDGYYTNVWLKKPFVGVNYYGRATCDWLFTNFYSEGAAWNATRWSNKRFTELLAQGKAESSNDKRQAIYAEMQQLIHDEGGTLIVAFANYVDGHSKKLVAPAKVGGVYPQDNLRVAERWWFAS